MKRSVPLLFIALAAPAFADPLNPALYEERVRFEERVQLAKAAESDEQLKNYPHAMFKRAGRHLARTMRYCIATSPKPEAKAFELVADINAKGKADAVDVWPNNAVSRCFAAGFSSATYLKAPEYVGREGFPVTLKIRVVP